MCGFQIRATWNQKIWAAFIAWRTFILYCKKYNWLDIEEKGEIYKKGPTNINQTFSAKMSVWLHDQEFYRSKRLRRDKNLELQLRSHWANIWIWLQLRQYPKNSIIALVIMNVMDCLIHKGICKSIPLRSEKVFFKPFRTHHNPHGEPLQPLQSSLMLLSVVILSTIMVLYLMSYCKYFSF